MKRVFEAIENNYEMYVTHSEHGLTQVEVSIINLEISQLTLKVIDKQFCPVEFVENPRFYDDEGWPSMGNSERKYHTKRVENYFLSIFLTDRIVIKKPIGEKKTLLDWANIPKTEDWFKKNRHLALHYVSDTSQNIK